MKDDPRVSHETLPSYSWLEDNGYMGLVNFVSDEFDTTFHVFLVERFGFPPKSRKGGWPGESEETHRLIEEFFEDRKDENCIGHSNSTIRADKSRMRKMISLYMNMRGHGNVLKPLREDPGYAFDTYKQLFKELKADIEASRRYAKVFVEFCNLYTYKKGLSNEAHVNAFEYLDWPTSEGETDAVSPKEVRRMVEATETTNEKVTMVLVGAAGARPNDIRIVDARKEAEQLHLGDDPHIQYPEGRKNGRGRGTIMAGVDFLREYVDYLEGLDDWEGDLLVTDETGSEYMDERDIRDTVKKIAERANVTKSNGDPVTPRNLRQHWITYYSRAIHEIKKNSEEYVGPDQGSSATEDMVESYVDDPLYRDIMRDLARDEFESIYEDIDENDEEVGLDVEEVGLDIDESQTGLDEF
jgi:hypothetical protein